MVIASLCDVEVITVVAVDVIWAVRHVLGIKRTHTSWTSQDFVGHFEATKGFSWVEEFRCDDHRDGKVGTELIVCPGGGTTVEIFVDAATVDHLWIDIILPPIELIYN